MGRIRHGEAIKRTKEVKGDWSERPFSWEIEQLLKVTESENVTLIVQNDRLVPVLGEKYMRELREIIRWIAADRPEVQEAWEYGYFTHDEHIDMRSTMATLLN